MSKSNPTPLDATLISYATLEKLRPDNVNLDVVEHFGQAGRSETHLGQLAELNQTDTYLA